MVMTWTTNDIPDLSGKLAIVTGATGGLGLETALVLASKGAEVVLAARNPDKGAEAERLIRARHPAANVRFDLLDLGDLASVAAFADRHSFLGSERVRHDGGSVQSPAGGNAGRAGLSVSDRPVALMNVKLTPAEAAFTAALQSAACGETA